MHRRFLVLLAILALVALPAPLASADVTCGEGSMPAATPESTPAPIVPDAEFPDEGGSLTIFAAASLTDAFAEIATRLEAAHPDLEIVIDTAGSQTLVTQLQQGARADVLATANQAWMTSAEEAGLIAGEPIVFAHNRLVIVAPGDNPAGIDSVDDLAGDDVSLVLANPDVPAGAYTRRAFCAYAARDGAPEGFIDAVNRNLVSEEPDVRNVLAKVQLGEADAGVVYASDAAAVAQAGTALTVIEFPAGVPVVAEYPIAALADGDVELADAFIAYVLGDEGQAILAEFGFSVANR